MDGLTVNLGASGGAFPVRRAADPVLFPHSEATSESPAVPEDDVSVEKLEDVRFEAVKKAATRMFPPSNERFVIFKDKETGRYVTIVRDINTGKTIQIPEAEMLERLALDSATTLLRTLV